MTASRQEDRASQNGSLGGGEILDGLCQVPSFMVTLVCVLNSYMGGHSGFLEEGVI